ncbi:MAG TPA: ChaN family lipoprotein, partial [Hyphomicrobium sp.]|nr:ChaN family lipoprotein [Hyphomicrobium sp.]
RGGGLAVLRTDDLAERNRHAGNHAQMRLALHLIGVEQRIARAVEESIGIPLVMLPRVDVMPDALAKVDGDTAYEVGALPFAIDGNRLRVAFEDPLDALAIEEIEDAHCGSLAKDALEGMAFAQRYRDAHLAGSVLKAVQQNGSAILIAGSGHARTDRAVPWYIRKLAPEKRVVSVIFVEIADDSTDAQSYVPRDPDGQPAADFVVFTQPAERGDSCEAMRKN